MLENLEKDLKKAFPGADIELTDYVSDGRHFEVCITSDKFQGLSLVDQHRLVNEVCKKFMDDGSLHALKIKTKVK